MAYLRRAVARSLIALVVLALVALPTGMLLHAQTTEPELPGDAAGPSSPDAPPTPTATPVVGALARRDVPANLADAQLSFAASAPGPPCSPRTPESAARFSPSGRAEPFVEVSQGRSVMICFSAFRPNEDVDVEVTRPDGSTERQQVRASEIGGGVLVWPLPSDNPYGQYEVSVIQGPVRVFTFFRYPASPQLAVVPTTGPPGTAFTISAAGFAPGESIRLRLFYALDPPDERSFRYATELPRLQADSRGLGVLTLLSTPDDPPTGYLVVNDWASASARFVLTR